MNAPQISTGFTNTDFNTAPQNDTGNSLSKYTNKITVIAGLVFVILVCFFVSLGLYYVISKMIFNQSKIIIPVTKTPIVCTKYTKYSITDYNDSGNGKRRSYTFWIYINDLTKYQGQYKHVFHIGEEGDITSGVNFPNNAPGLYIAPNTNALVVMMNTYNVINEEVVIPDIPLNKWINVIIRCQNTTLDVYINGTITRSVQLTGVPKQNYGDVYVAMNGGFNGYISNLWYYNYALGTAAIQTIANNGPNTKMVGSNGISDKMFNYLSLRWFFYGAGDSYNPPGPGGYDNTY